MKKNVIKMVLLVVLFLAVVIAGLYVALRKDTNKTEYVEMQARSLPQLLLEQETLAAQFCEDVETGLLLHGYTSEIDPIYVSNMVLPIGEDGIVQLHILTETEAVTGCSYAVRSLDTLELIEDTTVNLSECERSGDVLTTKLALTNLLESGKEYYLIVKLSTEGHEKICYYSRVYVGNIEEIGELAAFSEEFSEATFEKDKAKKMLPIYIQADDTMDNDDFGYVNLHSSYSMLTWGDMKVSVVPGTRSVTLYEVCPTQATVELKYQVAVEGVEQLYEIEEHYCVRKRNDRFYLLDYDRSMNQVYSYKEPIENGRLSLGIRAEAPTEYMTSDDGKRAAFVVDGTLYCYTAESNEMVRLFGFGDEEQTERAAGLEEHDIRIVNVTGEGTVQFLVYGYMLRGEHEGENGITFYEYHAEENGVTELFYICSSLPFDILREGVGTTAFVNESNLCYLIYGSGIYAVVLEDGEFYSVTDRLQHGSYAVSAGQDYVAWGNGAEDEGGCASAVTIMSMEDGHRVDISVNSAAEELGEAAEDCYLRVLGFLNDDLVYGIGRYEDIYYENGMNMICPLFELYIADGVTGELVGSYCKENVYVTGCEVQEARLILHRVSRKPVSDETDWDSIEDDLLMVNASHEDNSAVQELVQVKVLTDITLKKVYALSAAINGGAADKLYSTHDSLFAERQGFQLSMEAGDYTGDWRVYGRGQLLEIAGALSDAISAARDCAGYVRGRDGSVYWALTPKELEQTVSVGNYHNGDVSSLANALAILTHGKRSAAEYEAALAGEQVDELLTEEGDKVLTLYGCQVSDLAYYLNEGSCVIALLENSEAVVISGYSSDGSIQLTNPATGDITMMTAEEAAEYFDSYKNMFLTVL